MGTPRICNLIVLLIVWVRSFSEMLPTVKFAEDKVLVFVAKSNPNLNPNFQSRLIRCIGVVLSNGTLLANKSGSI